MKRVTLPIVVSMVPVLVFFVIIASINGCTSAAKKKEAYWNSQIGQAKYNDVVAQLGPACSERNVVRRKHGGQMGQNILWDNAIICHADNWTEELVLRFSPGGILTQSSLHEY